MINIIEHLKNLADEYEKSNDINREYLCYEQISYLLSENDEFIDKKLKSLNPTVNKVSIIILSYNQLEYTKECIESIKATTNPNTYEIIVVDNNSNEETVQWLKEQKDIVVRFNKENRGFPGGCNDGIEIASKENDIFLLNNDTVVMNNSIFNLRMALYSNDSVGAVGAVSNYVSNYQMVGFNSGKKEDYFKFADENNITNESRYDERTRLIGFAMLIKREALNKVGVLDEDFFPGNFEDDDLSLRLILNNYKLLVCWDSYIHHYGSVSFNKDPGKFFSVAIQNREKFKKKWGYDPNSVVTIYYDIPKYIKEEKNILYLFAGTGINIVTLKRQFTNKKIFGYEENESLIKVLNNQSIELVDSLNDDEYNNYFDMVIMEDYEKILSDENYIKSINKKLINKTGNLLLIIAPDRYNYFNKLSILDLGVLIKRVTTNGFELRENDINSDGNSINYGMVKFVK